MANQEDIARAKAGKDVWNAWAEKELKKPEDERVTVDFSSADFSGVVPLDTNFSGFVFPGYADFEGATFGDFAYFEGATFEGLADFGDATFEGVVDFKDVIFKSDAHFEGATFKGWTYFKNATFEGDAHFEGVKFESLAIFNNATFNDRTNFTDTYFEKAPWFHNAAIHQDTAFSFGEDFFRQFPDIKSDEAERAYRTLKLAMNKYQSHTEEGWFFKLELKARALKEKNRHWKWLYWAYDKFSDYGQSVSKPLIWWGILFFIAFTLYGGMAIGGPDAPFTVTLAQALPLFGVEKRAFTTALDILYPDGVSIWFYVTRALHMVASYFFIFLALLALRNRFKIK